MAETDIGFSPNWTNLYEIEIPSIGWARVGAGINNAEWEGNEEIGSDPYYDGDGGTDSDVTGGQIVGSFEGHRCYGDPAQDYIAGKFAKYGSERKTNFRWTLPDGSKYTGPCTVANISPQGGEPNAKSDFSFEIHFDGTPAYSEPSSDEFPTQISAEAVTVAEGATVQVTATVTPEGASPALVYAVDDLDIARVDSDGTLHGLKQGECNVNIKSAVKPTVQTTVRVTVSAAQTLQAKAKAA